MLRTLTIALLLLGAGSCTATVADIPARTFLARAYVETDVATAWKHLTEPEAITQWFSAPCCRFGSEVGDPVHFADDERAYYTGEIIAREEGRALTFRFSFVNFGFDESSRVEFDLIERGPTVLIEIRHDCTDAPETARIITPVGWAKSLSRLKTLLESGTAMPWPVEPGS